MIPPQLQAAPAFDSERPWRPQPFESHQAYAVFEVYLALQAPRRLEDVVRHFRRSELTLPVVMSLAVQGYWEMRAARWDERVREVRETATIEVVHDTAKEEAAAALRQHRLAARELAKWDRDSEVIKSTVLSAREAAKLRREARADLSLTRGEPSQRVEVSAEQAAKYKGMTDEQLSAFIRDRKQQRQS